jgi:hypothetical protein
MSVDPRIRREGERAVTRSVENAGKLVLTWGVPSPLVLERTGFTSLLPEIRQWVISNDAGRVKDVLILFYLMGSLVFPR